MTEQQWLSSADPGAMLVFATLDQTSSGWRHVSDRKLRLFASACHLPDKYWQEWGDRADGPRIKGGELAPFAAAQISVGIAAGRRADVFGAEERARRANILREIVGSPYKPMALPLHRRCWKCGDVAVVTSRQATHCYCGIWSDDPPFCPWLTPTVLSLAAAAYSERQAGGTLDPLTLCALADALEEAGCPSEEIAERPSGAWLCRQCESAAILKTRHHNGGTINWFWCPRHEWLGEDYSGVKGMRTVRTLHPILAHLRSPGPHYRGCHVLDLILGKN